MNPKKREIEEVLARIEADAETDEESDTEKLPPEFVGLLRAKYMQRANWGAQTTRQLLAVRRLMDQRNVARLETDEAWKYGEAQAACAVRWRWIALVELALLIASGIAWWLR